MQAIGMLEKNLGLTGHARVVVKHLKHGRIHYHVLWDRRALEGGPARRMANNYAIHLKTQREIEKAFKLRPMMAKGRDFKVSEVEWAKRYGYDIFQLREQITADFNSVKSGQSFVATLKAKGIVLCRGDKSQFVLVLPWGQHKALSSMIYGRPSKAVLRRALADIDIKKLPTVAEGKSQVKARLPMAKPRRKATGGISGDAFRGVIIRSSSRAKPRRPVSGRYPVSGRAKITGNIARHQRDVEYIKVLAPTSTKREIGFAPKLPVKTVKDALPLSPMFPHRPVARGSMCAEQMADFKAAGEGKITWRQYFHKWGGGGLSL